MTGAAIYTLINSIVRVFPLQASQGQAFPLATYTIRREPINDMNGPATSAIDKVQINVHAKTYDQTNSLANSVIAALDWKTGAVGSLNFINVRFTGSEDLYQDEPDVYAKALMFDFYVKL